jgi:hypothetical protein
VLGAIPGAGGGPSLVDVSEAQAFVEAVSAPTEHNPETTSGDAPKRRGRPPKAKAEAGV